MARSSLLMQVAITAANFVIMPATLYNSCSLFTPMQKKRQIQSTSSHVSTFDGICFATGEGKQATEARRNKGSKQQRQNREIGISIPVCMGILSDIKRNSHS
jgi:hypothetical protein